MDILQKLNAQKINNLGTKQWNDFLTNSVNSIGPWKMNSIGSGTISTASAVKHPGILSYFSSTTANSGYGIITSSSITLNGGEKTTTVFKTAVQLMGVTRRIGFHTSTDANLPINGVHCKIQDGTLTGQTVNNSIISTTATNYTLAANTWYRLKIEVSIDLTIATYTLFADDSNTILWQDTLTTNIPIGAVGQGDICTYSGTAVTSVGHIDYMDIFLPNARRVE